MKNKIALFFSALLSYSFALTAQVPVREEPFHQNVLENKYIRLLDVWIKPGDTSLLHIHSTPSLFLHFTSTAVCVQIKDQAWTKNKNMAGNASYRSFVNDTLVHRVSNCDTVPFHVTDVELLSAYKPAKKLEPLPFNVLFENEKVFAYRLTAVLNNQIIKRRGPMIAQLVAGSEVIIHNKKGKELSSLKAGKHVYIKPGTEFYFSAAADAAINMVLFEIK